MLVCNIYNIYALNLNQGKNLLFTTSLELKDLTNTFLDHFEFHLNHAVNIA